MNFLSSSKLFINKFYIKNSCNFRLVNSGKLALSLILNYLKDNKKINPKIDENFVPKFMGNWIYSSLNQNCFTSPVFTKDTKILYLYHQFGIPQDVEYIKNFAKNNNLLIIEDCAHAISEKLTNNYYLNNTGDFVIYSFTKFVQNSLLGGIKSDDKFFLNYLDLIHSKVSKKQSIINYLFLNLSKILPDNLSKKIINMNYSLYHFPSLPLDFCIKLYNQNIKKEIDVRLGRYKFFKKNFKKIINLDYLKYDNLICYKLPICLVNDIKEIVISKFEKFKFPYELLMFDINRNFIKPNYVKTLVLDINSKNIFFEKQLDIISNTLKL